MIKEFCMACRGTGISGYYNSATSHKVIDCGDCQGKGYTELEPSWSGKTRGINLVFSKTNVLLTNTRFAKREVYIKEPK